MATNKTVNASPTKAFFVNMITKDIELDDCILDLIDNSIDGALSNSKLKSFPLNTKIDLTEFSIELNISSKEFSIQDTCGGITRTEAEKYAFTFGRVDSTTSKSYSIGRYGIGMKRAIFKIGRDISITSTFLQSSRRKSFSVPIDVDKWEVESSSSKWDLPIAPASHLDSPGVKISIKKLNEDVAALFKSPLFISKVKRLISREYMQFIRNGMSILVNGQAISAWNLKLKVGKSVKPVKYSFKTKQKHGTVNVELIAGMYSEPPDEPDPDVRDEADVFGWYVICNGRIVLAADKTDQIGWGTGEGSTKWPVWHRQYRGFIGIISFSGDVRDLPLTTTKRDVDISSKLFRSCTPHLRDISKSWIEFTSNRKDEVKEFKKLTKDVVSKEITELKNNKTLKLPAVKINSAKANNSLRIAYSIPKDQATLLASELGDINMSGKDLGLESFQFTYNYYIEE